MSTEQVTNKADNVRELDNGQGVSFVSNNDYSFARGLRAAPVALHELRQVVPMLPLILARNDGQWRLMGLTGFANTRNLLVSRQGEWAGFYAPERWRFNPLLLMQGDDGAELGFNDQSLRLFAGGQDTLIDAEGNKTERYHNIRERLLLHVKSRALVQTSADTLFASDLLSQIPEESPLRLPGLDEVYQCSMQNFGELSIEALQALRECGGLNLAFAMHFSNVNVSKFQRMVKARRAATVDEDVVDALADEGEFSFNFDD